jgi:hypothetical protein
MEYLLTLSTYSTNLALWFCIPMNRINEWATSLIPCSRTSVSMPILSSIYMWMSWRKRSRETHTPWSSRFPASWLGVDASPHTEGRRFRHLLATSASYPSYVQDEDTEHLLLKCSMACEVWAVFFPQFSSFPTSFNLWSLRSRSYEDSTMITVVVPVKTKTVANISVP